MSMEYVLGETMKQTNKQSLVGTGKQETYQNSDQEEELVLAKIRLWKPVSSFTGQVL